MFSIDARCGDDDVLAAFEQGLVAAVEEARHEWQGGAISVDPLFSRGTTRFPADMLSAMERAVGHACGPGAAEAPTHVISGAFHDAMYLAAHCPTGMLFVPSRDGISHNAAEYTEPWQLVAGARALAHAVTELAVARQG